MSWDLSFYAAEFPPPPVAEMPSDWEGSKFGTLAEVRKQISTCLPNVDWSDPSWGLYDGVGFSYEFNIGENDHGFGFAVHVRGGGDAVSELMRLAEENGWYVLDTSQGEWWHHCVDHSEGWKEFQAYRDRVLGTAE